MRPPSEKTEDFLILVAMLLAFACNLAGLTLGVSILTGAVMGATIARIQLKDYGGVGK